MRNVAKTMFYLTVMGGWCGTIITSRLLHNDPAAWVVMVVAFLIGMALGLLLTIKFREMRFFPALAITTLLYAILTLFLPKFVSPGTMIFAVCALMVILGVVSFVVDPRGRENVQTR
jgi:hypothetical protein